MKQRLAIRSGLFRITVYMFEHPNSTYYSIQKGTGIPSRTTKARLQDLLDNGYAIRMEPDKALHNVKPYQLTSKGRNLARQIKVLRTLGVDS